MRVFLAGPGSLRHILGPIIRETLPSLGHESYDWTSGPGWDNPALFVPVEVARKDLEEIRSSDVVIRYVDGETLSDGAAFEAGYCLAAGIPLITWLASGADVPPSHLIYSHLTFEDGNHQLALSLEEALKRAEEIKAGNYLSDIQILQMEKSAWVHQPKGPFSVKRLPL